MGWYARFRYALDPFVTFLYATPRIVLLPLLIIWFGIGAESKVAVVFLCAVFSLFTKPYTGVLYMYLNLINSAHSVCASGRMLLLPLPFPLSVLLIITT